MILNKTTSYAIKILLLMAAKPSESFTAKQLHEELGINNRYLRKILTSFTKCKLIKSNRGKNGGFVLAKSIEKITISEIIQKVEGLEKFEECFLGNGDCSPEKTCEMHSLFVEIKEQMIKTFSETTLKDIKEKSSTNKYIY